MFYVSPVHFNTNPSKAYGKRKHCIAKADVAHRELGYVADVVLDWYNPKNYKEGFYIAIRTPKAPREHPRLRVYMGTDLPSREGIEESLKYVADNYTEKWLETDSSIFL